MTSHHMLEWRAADRSETVRFTDDWKLPEEGYAFILRRDIGGLMPNQTTVDRRSGINMVGERAHGLSVEGRVVTVNLLIIAESHEKAWEARENLAAAMWVEPGRIGEPVPTGVLRLFREGAANLEIKAIPESSPAQEHWDNPTSVKVTLEFWCPDPTWSETDDQVVILDDRDGFSGPLSGPFHAWSTSIEEEVINSGAVAAPFVARIYGPLVNPKLSNLTTDRHLRINITLLEDEVLEIDTGVSGTSLHHEDASGERTRVMGKLDLDVSDFWRMRRGSNQVRLTSDSAESTRVVVTWRQRFPGV